MYQLVAITIPTAPIMAATLAKILGKPVEVAQAVLLEDRPEAGIEQILLVHTDHQARAVAQDGREDFKALRSHG